jgi:hypothetical protein
LVASTIIILSFRNVEISKASSDKKNCEEKYWNFQKQKFNENFKNKNLMKISKWINY